MSVLSKALQTSRHDRSASMGQSVNLERAEIGWTQMQRIQMTSGVKSSGRGLAKLLVFAFVASGIAACSVAGDGQSSIDETESNVIANDIDSQADGSLSRNSSTESAYEHPSVSEFDTPATPSTDAVAAVGTTTEDSELSQASTPPVDSIVAETGVSDVVPAEANVPAMAESENVAVLRSVSLEQKPNKPSYVVLSLSQPAPFQLLQSTPTEYVLTLAGVSADTVTEATPQILPKGVPGIRSVRTMTAGNDTKVRMFVDAGVNVIAAPSENNSITIQAQPQADSLAALPPVDADSIRAQLQPPAGEKKPAAADEKPAVQIKENENTARENPTGLVSSDGSKVYTGRLISLDLQDTDIDNALRIIAEVSNLNIIASDDVTGKVTLRLIDVPWDQALDVILKTNGLDQVTEGNVIRIAPIEKLRQEREALREAKKAQEALEDLSVRYIRVSYARATELKEQVESVLSERGTVSIDERTNQLIIKDVKKGQQQASDLLKKLDLRTPQVLLETQIVESGRNLLRDLGFQWAYSEAHSPQTGNATGFNFPNSVNIEGTIPGGVPNLGSAFPAVVSATEGFGMGVALSSADGSRAIEAQLSALERERMVKVISRPQVATVNNKQAEISSVETIRVRLPSAGTAISTGSGATASSGAATAFQEIKVGIELTVTPQASPDYFVLLDIKAKSSTLGNRSVDNIPSTIDRIANSTVLIKSGQTFALGGVYRLNDQDQVSGIPFIKDIPVIGQFFRRTFFDKSDEELIFFITPHIVEGSFDAAAM